MVPLTEWATEAAAAGAPPVACWDDEPEEPQPASASETTATSGQTIVRMGKPHLRSNRSAGTGMVPISRGNG
jgi:hypothetical protein